MIDELRVADADGAAVLSARFGWPHRPEDWTLFLNIGHGLAFREAGRLCGTAMWFPLGPAHAAIGLVQVAQELQGRGIGRRLMCEITAAAAPRHLMLHATLAGAGLYAALGFTPGGKVQQWHGLCAIGPVAGTSVEVGCQDILQLDAAMTGFARGALLDLWLADATIRLRKNVGYAARRRFGGGNLIGPVVANDSRTAIELIRALAEPGFLRIDVPTEKSAIVGGLGLTCVDEVQIMTTGDWPSADRKFGLVAQALG